MPRTHLGPQYLRSLIFELLLEMYEGLLQPKLYVARLRQAISLASILRIRGGTMMTPLLS